MREENIEKMNFKELRNEVQLLRDELAKMKRMYEDLFYNLDYDNFSSRLIREKDNMKTQIEVNAEGIKTTVEKTDENAEKISTIEQTAEGIKTEVKEVKDDYAKKSEVKQTADEIYASVSQQYDDLDDAISSVSVTANSISTRVTNLETFNTSVFTQTANGFTLDGEQTTFTGVIYLTDNDGEKKFSIFHDESQGHEQVFIRGIKNPKPPIILGDYNNTSGEADVFIGGSANENRVATQKWVKENGGAAVFA